MSEDKLIRGETTRQEIINAAHELFVHQGFHGTSMRQVARQAGIALGSLYNHFPSKEAVFESVFLEYHPYREVLPAMMTVKGDSAEVRVREAFNLMLRALNERPEFFNLMFIEIVEFKSAHLNDLFVGLLPVGLQVARHIFSDADRLRPELPLAMVMRSFFGLFLGYYMSEIAFGQQAPSEFIDQAAEHMLNIFLRGVLVD
jgi:AcrR family transcriptional regulator